MHPDQLEIAESAAAALVAEQFDELAGLPVRRVVSDGTVVTLFRVGDGHAARFPLQAGSADASRVDLVREAALANMLVDPPSGASRMPVATPRYLGVGEPGHGYPTCWAVTSWIEGVSLSDQTSTSIEVAETLGRFVVALRELDPGVGPAGASPEPCPPEARGGELGAPAHDEWVTSCLTRSHHLIDVPAVTALWNQLRTLPRPAHLTWTHRDLMPGNILVADDDPTRVTGVIDAALAVCDPAVDMTVAWHLLRGPARVRFREIVDVDQATWDRGRGWALEQAVGALAYYEHSNPVMSRTAQRTLTELLADDNG